MITNSRYIYPGYAAKNLRGLWGLGWRRLVDWVTNLSPVQPEALAYSLMLRRLHALKAHEINSACSDPQCAVCATGALAHFQGTERDLMDEYYRTLEEVKGFLARQTQPARMVA